MSKDETRVSSWGEYVGQVKLKERLRTHINAAVDQMRPVEHILLAARAGFGKTSLAVLIAKELGARLVKKQCPLNEKALFDAVTECDMFGEYCVLFLDEIHGASKKEQEFLLPLLEFGEIQGRNGRTYTATNLTIIGATTEAHQLVDPLRDRFLITPPFDDYTDEDMQQIALGMATMVKVSLTPEEALALGKASGGTPRRLRTFIISARDLAVELRRPATAEEVLTMCRVDADGLSYEHYEYLRALHLLGGKTGLANLKNRLRLSESVVRELEMLLLEMDMIALGGAGRELLPPGARKIKIQRRPLEASNA